MDRHASDMGHEKNTPPNIFSTSDEAIEYYLSLPRVALDIETSDGRGGALDPFAEGAHIALVQMHFEQLPANYPRDGLVCEPDGEGVLLYRLTDGVRDFIEDLIKGGFLFVIHNAAFELYWFLKIAGLKFERVWDTMVASQILSAGKPLSSDKRVTLELFNRSVGGWGFSHNLASTLARYLKVYVEKDQATSNWSAEVLSAEQLRYAKDDVIHLIALFLRQLEFIRKFSLGRVAHLEMQTTLVTAHMQHAGIRIDSLAWERQIDEYEREARALKERLDLEFGKEMAKKRGLPTEGLFGELPPVTFNCASPAQLQELFGLPSAAEEEIKRLQHPLIPDLLRYKEVAKLASTYGDGYLSSIKSDGRIHASFPQAETATGRYKSRNPNLQNIPPGLLKSYIIPEDGYVILMADYSAVESRILAYISGDEGYINAVNSRDVHWENAKGIFGLPSNAERSGTYVVGGKEFSGEELRRRSKGVTFGIPYGITAKGLWVRGFANTLEEGEALITGFLGKYPKVDAFLRASVAEALSYGYTQDPFGRIRWYDTKDRARNQAMNHKIQSMSANITKQALVDIYRLLQKSPYGKIILTIHDSILVELRKDKADELIPQITRIMEEAGEKIFPGLKTPVDYTVKES